MRFKIPIALLSAVILCGTVSSGCDSFGNPLKPETMRDKPFEKSTPQQKQNNPSGEPADQRSAKLEEYQRPAYPNGVRRNPFQPDPGFLIQQAEFESENARVKEPLEAFGLGQLRLAAIISGVAVPKAMFIDPDGLGHFAKVGDRIGEGGLIISAIRENSVALSSDSDDEDLAQGIGGATQIIPLSDQIDTEEQQLSEEDRAALDRILNSNAGKEAVRKSFNTNNTSNSVNNNPSGTNGGQ